MGSTLPIYYDGGGWAFKLKVLSVGTKIWENKCPTDHEIKKGFWENPLSNLTKIY
jgi:hypothetical protein